MLAAIDGLDLTLTTNGSLLAAQGAGAARRRARRASRSASTRSTTRRSAPMNDVDFPVARVLEGIDAAAAAGLPGQGERGRQARRQRRRHRRHGRALPRQRRHVLRFIEFMDVGHTNGWRLDDVVPAAEIVGRDRRRVAARAGRGRTTPARSRTRWRYRDGAGEIGVIASVTQPFCGDCTRARISAEASSTRASSPSAATTCASCCAPVRPTRSSRERSPRVWTRRADRYSELRTEQTAALPKVEMSYIGG